MAEKSWAAYLPCQFEPQAPVRRGMVRQQSNGTQVWTCGTCYAEDVIRKATR